MVDTTPKPFVFVLMPFESKYDDIYKLGIKQACENAGAFAERVDEQIFDGSMLQRIYNQIDKADIIVADMTGRNPNVFYEVGYAHALGQYVILLTQNTGDIPFDLKHHHHIVYSDKIADKLIPDLEKRIRWAIEHSEDKEIKTRFPLKLYLNGTELKNEPTIAYEFCSGFTDIVFDTNNSDRETIQNLSISIALITPKIFSEAKGDYDIDPYICETFPYGDDKLLHTLNEYYQMMPGAWKKITFRLIGEPISGQVFKEKFILQIITDYEKHEYPFILTNGAI